MLCYWRDRVPEALELLKKMAADKQPRVRLEAVRAASFFPVPETVEVPLIAQEQPGDAYLDFLHNETMKTLNPIVKSAVDAGKSINVTSEPGIRFFLRNLPLEKVLKLERTIAVNRELLYRAGVRDELRREALQRLAGQEKKPEMQVLLEAIGRIDDLKESRDQSVSFDLVRLLTPRPYGRELGQARAALEKLAVSAHQPVLRQIGFVTMIHADGSARQGVGAGGEGEVLAARPGGSDAADRRPESAGQPLSEGRAAAGEPPEGWGVRHPGPLCPHRAAGQPEDADPGGSGSVTAMAATSPARARRRSPAPTTAASPAGPSTATRAAVTAAAARRTPRRGARPVVGSGPGARGAH